MRPSIWKGVLLLFVALAPVAWAQPSGACHATDVPGPIVLPDNSIEESGRLQVCLNRMYSPVAGFHRMSVNGRVSGLFVSRKVTGAAPQGDLRPQFVFTHLADGTYELESYALSDGNELITFEMRPASVRSRWHVRRAALDTTPAIETVPDRVVMPAATIAGF